MRSYPCPPSSDIHNNIDKSTINDLPSRYVDIPAEELRGNEYNDVCGRSDDGFKNWQKEHLINGIRGFSPPSSLGTNPSMSGTINLPVSPAQRVSVPPPPVVSGWKDPFVFVEPEDSVHTNDPSMVLPAIRQDAFSDGSFMLPGTGKITHPETFVNGHGRVVTGCGEFFAWAKCSSLTKEQKTISHNKKEIRHFARPMFHTCHGIMCPTCSPSWYFREAGVISNRFHMYINAARAGDDDWHKRNAQSVRHFILSPPPGIITQDMKFDRIKQIGKAFAARAWITGGNLEYHPWRIKDPVKLLLSAKCRELTGKTVRGNEDEREKKFWELIKLDVLNFGKLEDYVFFSPHFHIIGFGYTQDGQTFNKETGWIVKTVRNVVTKREFKNNAIKDNIRELAAYILSHAGYIKGKKIPVWFGVCEKSVLRKDGIKKDSHEMSCPACGKPILLCQPIDSEVAVPITKIVDGKRVRIKCRVRDYREYGTITGDLPDKWESRFSYLVKKYSLPKVPPA